MELGNIVLMQVLIMFIIMMIGLILAKKKLIDETGTKQITFILLNIVTPCVLINAYQQEFKPQLVKGLLSAVILSILVHLVAIVISTIIFKKESTLKYRINIFTTAYSNCGFMAIPLLSATLGNEGVFYGSAYLGVFTVLYWTHGIYLYTGDRKSLSLKKALINPGVIGTAVSILLFLLSIRLPYVLKESVSYMASLNTPLAMIVLGTYLAKLDIKRAFKEMGIYVVLLLRHIVIPLIAILFIKVFNFNAEVGKAVLISSACPSAVVAALFAVQHNLDSEYASRVVAISTVLSIITIPLIMFVYLTFG